MTHDESASGSKATLERAARELAAATAALVEEHDVVGTLTQLLAGCARAVEADAAGLLLQHLDSGRLELLASTSHRAAELELYQMHSDEGPCVEAAESGQSVSAYGAEAIAARWPALAGVFAKNGFTAAHATPLRWHGRRLGALGLFFVGPIVEDQETTGAVGEAFADVATLAIVNTQDLPLGELMNRTRSALAERILLEQAKGVLAHAENLDMDAAFDRLLDLSGQQHCPVSDIAARIVADAAIKTDRD